MVSVAVGRVLSPPPPSPPRAFGGGPGVPPVGRSVGRSVASPLCKKEREFIRSEQSRSVATREGPEPEKGREGKTRDLSVSILSVPASVVRYRDHRDEVGHHRPRRVLRGSRR